MKELMSNEDFSDVTLVTEDKKHIKANINILSTCSPVFKDVLRKKDNTNQIMELRGVQHSEMEPIMQFIYLGEATFYKEKIGEILAVAKSLKIKELCSAETVLNNDTSNEFVKEETVKFENITKQAVQQRQGKVAGKYECDQCRKTFSGHGALYTHKQTVHQGVQYACDQCDYQATTQGNLGKGSF